MPAKNYRRRVNRTAAKALIALVCALTAFAVASNKPPVQEDGTAPIAEVAGFSLAVDGLERADLVRVVDGDTIVTRADDGSEQTVRLLSCDAPESVSPVAERNCEEGVQASEHLKETLPAGTGLWLSRDTSDTDKYDRSLRFVWTEQPEGDTADSAEFCSKCLNARLVAEGWAQAKEYPPDTTACPLLSVLGDRAAAEGLGVSAKWAA